MPGESSHEPTTKNVAGRSRSRKASRTPSVTPGVGPLSKVSVTGVAGVSFAPSAVKADNFDAVFEVKVNTLPSIPVLWNQTAEARWDGVVCNVGKANRGAVKVDPSARFGYLDLNTCTMFSNFRMLDLTTVDPLQLRKELSPSA